MHKEPVMGLHVLPYRETDMSGSGHYPSWAFCVLSRELLLARKRIIDMEEKEYKGYNGTLVLNNSGVVIKRGAKGFLLGGGMLRGDKSIPYSSIVAVQLKKAGLVAGYIQLTLMGGSEAKGGMFQSATDENSVNFHAYGKNNEIFEEAKEIIEKKIHQSKGQNSDADDLEKFAQLRDKGILTEEEFQAKKKQLLGI